MAEIKPFKGVLYDAKRVDIANVVAPPYDVISPGIQDNLYKIDDHNIVRIILGKEKESDTSSDSKYSRADKFLQGWSKQKIFLKDKKPSLYVYSQEYLHKGLKRQRIGFIALMKIEDPKESGVLPHEYTLDKPKEDRLNLITKTRANLSPIFSLFQDRENKINKILKSVIKSKEPLFAIDTEGVLHKFWRISDKTAITEIVFHMKTKRIFIADGHHRYEVALAYRNKMRARKNFNKSMDYVMMYFTGLSQKSGNLTVLSTHRAVKIEEKVTADETLTKLKKHFNVKGARSIKECLETIEKGPRSKHAFGMYTGKGRLYILTLKKPVKKLDVAILHELIINKILGVKNTESSIKYIRDEKAVFSLVDRGDYQVAFFLRPTAVSDMKSRAEKGEMMPQKSTYFYPKLLTGLVINKF